MVMKSYYIKRKIIYHYDKKYKALYINILFNILKRRQHAYKGMESLYTFQVVSDFVHVKK